MCQNPTISPKVGTQPQQQRWISVDLATIAAALQPSSQTIPEVQAPSVQEHDESDLSWIHEYTEELIKGLGTKRVDS